MATMAQGKGGLSQGKGGGASPTLPKQAGGPIGPSLGVAHAGPAGGPSAGIHSGMLGRGSGDLAALFGANQGYGGGGSGTLPLITQPTRESMGMPDVTKMLSPRAPVQPVAPPPREPTIQEIQQRISQGTSFTPTYSQDGGVNAMGANAGGKAQRWLEYYNNLKARNPTLAQQVLERSPYKSIVAPVQGAAPAQPPQLSRAAQLAAEINRRAGDRFA